MKTLKITRSKWLRDNGNDPEYIGLLLNDEGGMCCLGFACKQLAGMEDKELLDLGTPASVFDNYYPNVSKEQAINAELIRIGDIP